MKVSKIRLRQRRLLPSYGGGGVDIVVKRGSSGGGHRSRI